MSKEKIEEYIKTELSRSDQIIPLDFIDYLNNNDMIFIKDNDFWKEKIYYIIKFNNECVCFIAINDPDEKENRWTVWSDDMSSITLVDYPVENELKELAWKHVDSCGNCGSCAGGRKKVIFGKVFEKVCGCTFRIDNANSKDLVFLKKMIEIRKHIILKNEQFN